MMTRKYQDYEGRRRKYQFMKGRRHEDDDIVYF